MQWGSREVEFIKSLAGSYHRKLSVVDEKTKDLSPHELWIFMRHSGERILDQYRETQSRLLRKVSADGSGEDILESFRLLTEQFDEMHVLFFKLLERYYKDAVTQNTERSRNQEDIDGSG